MKTTRQSCIPYVRDFLRFLSRYKIKRTNNNATCNWKSTNKELLRGSYLLASSETTKKRLDLVYLSIFTLSIVKSWLYIIDPQPICTTRKPIRLTRINAGISSLPARLASKVSFNKQLQFPKCYEVWIVQTI